MKFGQWLALAAWLPVVFQLGSAWISKYLPYIDSLNFSNFILIFLLPEGVKAVPDGNAPIVAVTHQGPENADMCKDTSNSPLVHPVDPSESPPCATRAMGMEYFSADTSYQPESTYSSPPWTNTNRARQQAMEQWQASGW